MDARSLIRAIAQPLPIRVYELLVAVLAFGAGAGLLYLAGHGLLDRAGLYRTTCDGAPWVCRLCLGAGGWAVWKSIRLLRGPSSRGSALLFRPELLLVSLAIIGGSVWLLADERPTFNLRVGAFGLVGVVGVWHWWRRRGAGKASSHEPAA